MYAEGKPGDEPMPGRTKESVQDLSHEAQITTTCEPPRTRQIPPLPQTTSRNRLRQETTLGPRTSTLERKSIAAAVRQRAYTDPPTKLNNRERFGGSIPRLRTSMAIGAPDGHGMQRTDSLPGQRLHCATRLGKSGTHAESRFQR